MLYADTSAFRALRPHLIIVALLTGPNDDGGPLVTRHEIAAHLE